MTVLLMYTGTVKLGDLQIELGGYNLGSDPEKLMGWLSMLLQGLLLDSESNSPPEVGPWVELKIELRLLPSLPTSSGNSENAASSRTPTTISSATRAPASGGSLPHSGGQRTAAVGTPVPSLSGSRPAAGK